MSHNAEKVKGGPLWRQFLKNSRKNLTAEKRRGKSQCQKIGKEGLCNAFVFHVRGFGCVQNQVLNTYGKSAQTVVHTG